MFHRRRVIVRKASELYAPDVPHVDVNAIGLQDYRHCCSLAGQTKSMCMRTACWRQVDCGSADGAILGATSILTNS
jgi:hypothetical protein